jgi:hypothetical protein
MYLIKHNLIGKENTHDWILEGRVMKPAESARQNT